MSKEREALKLALECVMAWDRGCDRDPYWRDIEAAVTAIKEALAEQPAQHDLKPKFVRNVDGVPCITLVEHEHLLNRQTAQQQEPVAWLSRDDARLALWDAINKREFGNPTDDKLILDHLRKNGLWIGKYTSPPASKPWVGLTDVEWMNIVNKDHAWFGQRPEEVAHEVAKLVEAKLREKNT